MVVEKSLQIRVRFFGYTAERAGCAGRDLEIRNATVAGVADAIRQEFPGVLDDSIRFAVGTEYADDGTPVREGDIVSLLPPVGGG